MKEIKLTIPNGYEIKTTYKNVTLDEAYGILKSRRQRLYKRAIRDDNNVTLEKEVRICPYCGYKVSNNVNYFSYRTNRVGIETISNWTSNQLNIFDDIIYKGRKKVLVLNMLTIKSETLHCPKCTRISYPVSEYIDIYVKEDGNKLTILKETTIDFILKYDWIKDIPIDIDDMRVFEGVTFNIRNGRTYYFIDTLDGKRLITYEVTNDASSWSDIHIEDLILSYEPLNREIRKFFRKYWDGKLPYRNKEICIGNLSLMTKYVGHDRKFYERLPFYIGTRIENPSFRRMANEIRNINNVPIVTSKMDIPHVKSIKKVIYQNLDLLFYKEEIEKISNILNNVDFLNRFLESKDAKKLLWQMNMHPGLYIFYEDLTREISKKKFLSLLCDEKYQSVFNNYGIVYSTMSNYHKRNERCYWGSHFIEYLMHFSESGIMEMTESFNLPYCYTYDRGIDYEEHNNNHFPKDTKIDGYYFHRLQNSKEYYKAGEDLTNCLSSYIGTIAYEEKAVIGIKKDGLYVAAIELAGDKILQAHIKNNEEMSADEKINQVYLKWKKLNNLD